MTGALVDVLAAARGVQSFCESQGWKFCIIGGVAVQRWGNPRFTADVDLTLLTGYGGEERFIDTLLEKFEPRRQDGRQFAIRNRVLLARTEAGVEVDVALGALPFEERSVERATNWSIGDGSKLLTCSAEDLIVHKTFAGRDRDWDDVRGVLTRQYGKLDFAVIRNELAPLLELKEAPEAMQKFERIVADVARHLEASR